MRYITIAFFAVWAGGCTEQDHRTSLPNCTQLAVCPVGKICTWGKECEIVVLGDGFDNLPGTIVEGK